MLMYEGEHWMLKDRDAGLLRVYEDKEDLLSDWVQENKDSSPKVFELFTRYNNMRENNEDLINDLLKDVKILMYNNRHKIKTKEDFKKIQGGFMLENILED